MLPILLMAFPLVALGDEGPQEDRPTAEQIGSWVKKLGSEVFFERERAAEQLLAAGPAAVDALSEAAAGSDPEIVDQAVRLLLRMSQVEEGADQRELAHSEALLRRIAQLEDRPLESGAAQAVLSTYDRKRAILKIKSLGGTFEAEGLAQRQRNGAPQLEVLRLGAEWEGGDDGLEHVNKLTDLRLLRVHGTDVSDKGLPHLHNMHRLVRIELYGTEVTPEGVARLRQALPTTQIEHRLGAVDGGAVEPVDEVDQGMALTGAQLQQRGAAADGEPVGRQMIEGEGEDRRRFIGVVRRGRKQRPERREVGVEAGRHGGHCTGLAARCSVARISSLTRELTAPSRAS